MHPDAQPASFEVPPSTDSGAATSHRMIVIAGAGLALIGALLVIALRAAEAWFFRPSAPMTDGDRSLLLGLWLAAAGGAAMVGIGLGVLILGSMWAGRVMRPFGPVGIALLWVGALVGALGSVGWRLLVLQAPATMPSLDELNAGLSTYSAIGTIGLFLSSVGTVAGFLGFALRRP